MAVEFDRRPAQYEPYRVETWISGYNRALSTRNFRLLGGDGEPFAKIVSQWAMLDLASRTAKGPIRPSASWSTAISISTVISTRSVISN